MVGKLAVAVKRIPIALFIPLKETVNKLMLPKYQQHEQLVRYVVRYLHSMSSHVYVYVVGDQLYVHMECLYTGSLRR